MFSGGTSIGNSIFIRSSARYTTAKTDGASSASAARGRGRNPSGFSTAGHEAVRPHVDFNEEEQMGMDGEELSHRRCIRMSRRQVPRRSRITR